MSGPSAIRRHRLAQSRLYLVCDRRSEEFLAAALRGGVDLVQLRMKGSDARAVVGAARQFKHVCAEHGALLIVNDSPELALQAGADGVHLGQDDMPVQQARQLLGEACLIGLSTHTPEQIDAAAPDVDYIGVGPVCETPTKPGRPAVGLELVSYAAQHSSVPFFAIGGISADNVGAVAEAGARRVAVVRALTEATDPEQAARDLISRLTAVGEVPAGAT